MVTTRRNRQEEHADIDMEDTQALIPTQPTTQPLESTITIIDTNPTT